MNDAMGMATPVTRGELRAEIEHLEVRLEQKFEHMLEDKLEKKLEDKLEKKLDEKLEQKLEHMLEQKLEEKLEKKLDEKLDEKLEKKLAHLATKADLDIWGGALLERLLTEIARHTRAVQEAMSTQISVIDDKYADLPARVTNLESSVFPPARR